MLVAFKHILGNDADVKIEHSIDKGVYCTSLNKEINEKIILDIENEMKKMVSIDYKYVKLSVSRRDAIKFYKKKNQLDKAEVLKYISNTYVNLYRLDEYYDYFFSELPYSTCDVDSFKLTYIMFIADSTFGKDPLP